MAARISELCGRLSHFCHARPSFVNVVRNISSSSSKMLASALRAAARPAARVARQSFKPARAFSVTARASSGGPPPPQLFGEGAKPGTVPTDIEQATGLERLQLLGELEGISVFDDQPLDSSRLGTKADPVKVLSYVRAAPD